MPNPKEPIPSTVIKWGPITIYLTEMTPERAKEFMEENTHNRKLRYRVVDSLVADMQAGNWQFNGDAIRRALDCTVLDGQHRMQAAIDSGETIVVLVVDGLDMPSQETMDDGTKRTFTDTLKLRGEVNSDALSGILWRVTTWELGGGTAHGSRVRATKAQKSATLEKYPWLRDLARPAKQAANQAGVSPSMVGFCWWMFTQIDADDAASFFARLGDGQNLAEGHPVYELRRLLRGHSPNLTNDRWLTAVFIKAWNFYRRGESIKILKFVAGGANPETFPHTTLMTTEPGRADPMTSWLDEHQDDAVMVTLLDLMRLAARLGQVAERTGDSPARDKAIQELCETDLPRLEAVLPPQALEIIAEEIR